MICFLKNWLIWDNYWKKKNSIKNEKYVMTMTMSLMNEYGNWI